MRSVCRGIRNNNDNGVALWIEYKVVGSLFRLPGIKLKFKIGC